MDWSIRRYQKTNGLFHNHKDVFIEVGGKYTFLRKCPLCREEPPDEIKIQFELLYSSSMALPIVRLSAKINNSQFVYIFSTEKLYVSSSPLEKESSKIMDNFNKITDLLKEYKFKVINNEP